MVVWAGNGMDLNWLPNIPEQTSGVIHHPIVGSHSVDIKSGIFLFKNLNTSS